MVKRAVALAICLGLFPAVAFAQSPVQFNRVNLDQPQAKAGMTLDEYQWAQQYEEARARKGRGKTWLIIGGVGATAGLLVGLNSNSVSKGTIMAASMLPGVVVGGMGYLGYRGGTNTMRELEARRPRPGQMLFGTEKYGLMFGTQNSTSLSLRMSW